MKLGRIQPRVLSYLHGQDLAELSRKALILAGTARTTIEWECQLDLVPRALEVCIEDEDKHQRQSNTHGFSVTTSSRRLAALLHVDTEKADGVVGRYSCWRRPENFQFLT